MARILERADDSARGCYACSAYPGADCGGGKPTCSDDRTQAGDCQQAEAGEQSADAAKRGTGGNAACDIAVIVHAIAIGDMVAMYIACHDTDGIAWNAGCLERAHRSAGIGIVIEQAGDGFWT